MWNFIFYVSIAILCVLCLIGSILAARTAARVVESQQRRLRSCESRIESVDNSLDEMRLALTETANRVKMQRVRSAANHATGSSGEPDPYKNPDEWRSMMSRKLALAKTGMTK